MSMPIFRAYNFQGTTYQRSAIQFSRNLNINLSASDRAECKTKDNVRKLKKFIFQKTSILIFLPS